MKRLTIIKIHLYLSGVALIFMSLMTISGSLHLFMGDEDEKVSLVKTVAVNKEMNKEEFTNFFADELKLIDVDYKFSYIKGSNTSLVSRPTNRTYYTIKIKSNTAEIEKHQPTLRKKIMEFHKGHGARTSRTPMGILGFIILGAVLSGLWLGFSSKALRQITLITTLSGVLIFLILFLM